MKKASSILLALFILLAGMHMSVAEHFCGGKLASVNVSFSGEKANCGMPEDDGINSNCCKNHISYFSVDENYTKTTINVGTPDYKLLQLVAVPVLLLNLNHSSSIESHTNVSPPDQKIASIVNLADICVFRI